MGRDRLIDLTKTYLPTGAAVALVVTSVGFYSRIQADIQQVRDALTMQHRELLYEVRAMQQGVVGWVHALGTANQDLRVPQLTVPSGSGR